MNRKVFGLMLGVIGISFLVIMSFEAQASTLEDISAEVSQEAYHHDLKTSAAINYLSEGEDFGVLDEEEISITDFEGCTPDSAGLYTDLGGQISTEPFFDNYDDCNEDIENYMLVTGLKHENGEEDYVSIRIGE